MLVTNEATRSTTVMGVGLGLRTLSRKVKSESPRLPGWNGVSGAMAIEGRPGFSELPNFRQSRMPKWKVDGVFE